MNAVLYLRLSSSDDASTSIVRQEADLRALCERHGWDVVEVLTDDGISGTKVRANATEALRMLRAREADVLAVWKLDRWGRRGAADVADLVAVLDERKDARFIALQDGLDSTQQAWRLIASVLSEVGRAEAENTSTRIRSSIAHRRRVGRHTGGRVPFGYRTAAHPDGQGRILEPDPVEAPIVREVAERLLRGETPTSVCRGLALAGVPTALSVSRRTRQAGGDPTGLPRGTWYVQTIRKVWGGDPLAGRVMAAGALIRGEDGLPVQRWEPILDVGTLGRLRDVLGLSHTSPRLSAQPVQKRRAARLLSGVAVCGVCSRRLYVRTKGTGKGQVPVYACPAGREGGFDCGSPSITAERLEGYVTDQWRSIVGPFAEVRSFEVRSDEGVAEALAEVEENVRETTAALGLDGADLGALVARLEALKATRARLRATPSTVETVLEKTGRTFGEAWDAFPDDGARRDLLFEALHHVEVFPAVRRGGAGGGTFDSDRVRIIWRAPEEVASFEDFAG